MSFGWVAGSVAGSELRVTSYGLRVTGYELRVAGLKS
jgi:hypothetical protein